MKKYKTAAVCTLAAFLVTNTFDAGKLAFAIQIGTSSSAAGSAAASMGNISESAGPVQSFQADLFTGRAQTSVPIFVPPGRKNIQPNLGLSYSSSGGNGWLGNGWSLDVGFIQRDVKNGVPKYTSGDKYIFSYQGVYSELISVGTNEYRAKDEALFLKFVYDPTGNTWTVTDKSGTKHHFGQSSASRQAGGGGTFKWALSKVIDTSGNYMSVAYTTDGGQLYLSTIDYNGNETQSFAHTHKVEFTIEDRTDDSFSYISGAKIETNKRLKEVQVKVKESGAYALSRKYVLTYETSAATEKSRLKTVTEYGTDGVTALPAVTFTYQDKVMGFESMTDYTGLSRLVSSDTNYDYARSTTGDKEVIVDLIDINGDGFHDRVQAQSGNSNWKVQYNDGTDFGSLTDFGPIQKPGSNAIYDFIGKQTDAGEQAVEFLDINGDGLQDRIIAQDANTSWFVQLNEGTGFDDSTSWSGIERMVSSVRYDYVRYITDMAETKVDIADMNGDGLPDRIQATDGNTNWKVQWNTGSGFSSMVNFGPIEKLNSIARFEHINYVTEAAETAVALMDLNGDGLPDRIQTTDGNTNWKVQWNTGSGFTSMQNFGPIERSADEVRRYYIRYTSEAREQHVDLIDLNADGLPDRVQGTDSNTYWKVQWNTGTGFTSMEDYGPIGMMSSSVRYSYPRWSDGTGNLAIDMTDMDGDGIADRIQSESGNSSWKFQKNKGPYPDLLKEVDNGRGGKTIITYTPSTQFDNTDGTGKHRLPFPIQTVTKVVQQDGMGNSYETNYVYEGGMFDGTAREFRGFREVTVTDAAGTETRHTFGQTDTTKGKLLTKEVWGYPTSASTFQIDNTAPKVRFSREETTWATTNPYTGVSFTHVTQQDNTIYDGDETSKQTRQTFTYDSYGNLASTTEQGDINVTGDERKTANVYTYNTTNYILNTLAKTTLYKEDLTTRVSERYFYYDGATATTTAPVKGLLTKEIEWLNTCVNAVPDACHPTTVMTYDSYGNVATIKDARNYTTTNTYETTYRLFLTQIQNALTHTRQFTYNARIAQILTSTDQNNQVTTTEYDALGRVVKVIAPLDSSAAPTQTISYDFSAVPNKTTTTVKSSIPGQTYTYLNSYSFTDGLGREIQRRSPDEDPTKQIVTGTVTFDTRGMLKEEYTPYLQTTAAAYQTPVTSGPKATYSYDAVGRRTRIDYPDSTVSKVVFSDFEKTTTDPRGKQKRYTNDAYGRLVKVEEFNSGDTYSTTYEYDVLNNLKKTTDHLANITMITYDSLSRKTGMTDPDMGTWSYAYDANDNLTSQTDAKSQTISFTYDALNRVTLKNLPAGETDAAYTYDDALVTYSKGRLTKVTDGSGTHEFTYDALGRVLTDKKTVDAAPYTFTRTYDSMGRVRTLTYPDTEVVTYAYNNMGDVETISGVKSSVTTHYVKDVDYNPSGQITHVTYGNNVTSDYTYNAQTLRLSNILTKKADQTKLQDLSYTFDNNGNVTQISDLVNSMSQTFTYDDLNRLLTATGSAYGSESYTYDAIGNMTSKDGQTMVYGEGAAGPHAVTSITSAARPAYCPPAPATCAMVYDANGNMTDRGQDELLYDSENRLKEMHHFEGTTGTHEFSLSEGWNLISFTYLPDNRSITSVLSSLTFGSGGYDQISYYDPATSSWKHFVNDPDFNDFSEFEAGRSYEIHVTKTGGASFSVTGKSPAVDVNYSLAAGENFFSPAVKTATNVSTLLTQFGLTIGTHISDVKRFNTTTDTFESYVGGAFTQFEPKRGYVFVGLQSASFSYGKTETVTTFTYDSAGARVKKSVTGGATSIYLGKDYEIEGAATTKHVFLGDRRITTKKSSGEIQYIHEDHINSSNVITDASGNQSALLEYSPYGSTATHTGSVDPKHKFTGQEEDATTDLYYYNARYYDPQLGRFITADPTIQHPTDPQDFNRYAYARSNPIRYTDPTGLGIFDWAKKLVKKMGGAKTVGIGVGLAWGPVFGFAAYRATQAWLAGGSKREIITAGINGATEPLGYAMNPSSIGDIKKGPVTDHFTRETRVVFKSTFRAMGMDPVTAELTTIAIEVTLTHNNRNYNAILAPTAQRVENIDRNIRSGLNFVFSLFSVDYNFKSTVQAVLNLAKGGIGGMSVTPGEFTSIDFTPTVLYGANVYVYHANGQPEDTPQRNWYGSGGAFSVSASFVRDKNWAEKPRNVRFDVGWSMAFPMGPSWNVAKKNDKNQWERTVFK